MTSKLTNDLNSYLTRMAADSSLRTETEQNLQRGSLALGVATVAQLIFSRIPYLGILVVPAILTGIGAYDCWKISGNVGNHGAGNVSKGVVKAAASALKGNSAENAAADGGKAMALKLCKGTLMADKAVNFIYTQDKKTD